MAAAESWQGKKNLKRLPFIDKIKMQQKSTYDWQWSGGSSVNAFYK